MKRRRNRDSRKVTRTLNWCSSKSVLLHARFLRLIDQTHKEQDAERQMKEVEEVAGHLLSIDREGGAWRIEIKCCSHILIL